MTKWITLVLLLTLLLSSITLTGCSSGDDDETQPEEAATQTEKATSEPTEQVSTEETQTEEVTSEPTEQPTPEDTQQEEQTPEGDLSWDDIPIYSGAELDATDECAPQWQECETCEHRVYMTDASAEDVCSFYEDEMPAQGWDKLVYQYYPEGSCMGTWMEDMGNSSGPRVMLNVGHPSGDKNTTFIAITMGSGCP